MGRESRKINKKNYLFNLNLGFSFPLKMHIPPYGKKEKYFIKITHSYFKNYLYMLLGGRGRKNTHVLFLTSHHTSVVRSTLVYYFIPHAMRATAIKKIWVEKGKKPYYNWMMSHINSLVSPFDVSRRTFSVNIYHSYLPVYFLCWEDMSLVTAVFNSEKCG